MGSRSGCLNGLPLSNLVFAVGLASGEAAAQDRGACLLAPRFLVFRRVFSHLGRSCHLGD